MITRVPHERTDEHPGEWIEVGPLTFGFKNQWNIIVTDEDAIKLTMPVITAWYLKGADDEPLPPPSEASPDAIPVETVAWIVRTIRDVLQARITNPFLGSSPSHA